MFYSFPLKSLWGCCILCWLVLTTWLEQNWCYSGRGKLSWAIVIVRLPLGWICAGVGEHFLDWLLMWRAHLLWVVLPLCRWNWVLYGVSWATHWECNIKQQPSMIPLSVSAWVPALTSYDRLWLGCGSQINSFLPRFLVLITLIRATESKQEQKGLRNVLSLIIFSWKIKTKK